MIKIGTMTNSLRSAPRVDRGSPNLLAAITAAIMQTALGIGGIPMVPNHRPLLLGWLPISTAKVDMLIIRMALLESPLHLFRLCCNFKGGEHYFTKVPNGTKNIYFVCI